eukprot:3707524-Pleurochrysis_carterae.AAC.2
MWPTSLRSLASIAAGNGMHMCRWKFVAAYLQGELQPGEVAYRHAPPGYAALGADVRLRICRLEKPVYGMAQAGRRWQWTLFPWLFEIKAHSVFLGPLCLHPPRIENRSLFWIYSLSYRVT